MDITKIKQTMYIILNDDSFKEYAEKNGIVTPNSLSDEDFIRLSKTYGKNYDIYEFEMFWNTGKIPAFCYLRLIGYEEA